MAICLMALVQYAVNTALAAIASSCQINQPIWPTWKKYYLWASLTYFAGASAAGLIAKLAAAAGFYAVLVTLPIIAIIYFTYRTYLRNIEASITQAEQAERHIEELSRYIAERERAERERDQLLIREQEARREAEAANRVKDEFLATLSHELRTPMTAILGWSHLLADIELDDHQRSHAIEAIGRNARVQVQLINDLLDMSRIITGKLKVETRPIKLQSVIAAAIDSVRPAADAKAIQICMLLEPDSGIVQGDPDRLQQVVWNLLSNAIKFTPSGGQVTVRLANIAACAQLTVSDTGQGIKPEFLPYVFDRFRQADSSDRRTHGGLGLGLAIVRHLVELHGGTVHAQSQGEGLGTTMQVRLPLLACQPESSSASEANGRSARYQQIAPLAGVHVLVVDDDADVLELLATVLKSHGASVTAALSAAEALSAIKRARPHVLISDISMPVINGYELIRAVRSLPPESGGRIPAASVTAFAREEDRLQSLAAGFQTHIPKPVLPDELVEIVARLAGRSSAAHS
jgi:signal transduction histidine kinase/ActR/RegA family two-component response regulator